LDIQINKRPFVIQKAIQITKGKAGGERREEAAHPAPVFQQWKIQGYIQLNVRDLDSQSSVWETETYWNRYIVPTGIIVLFAVRPG
jgi:hypothetical protein